MPLTLPPLYAILDPEQTHGRAAGAVLHELLEGGVTLLQLRVKSLAPRDFLDLAHQARAETQARGCKLIVNDRIDIALACDAGRRSLWAKTICFAADENDGRKSSASRTMISNKPSKQSETAPTILASVPVRHDN